MIAFDIRNKVLYGAKYSGNDECLDVPQGVEKIANLEIGYTIETMTIPESVKEIEIDAFKEGSNLLEIYSNSKFFVVDNGCLYNFDKTILFLANRNLHTTVNVPTSVKKISSCAFAHCTRLREINLHNKIEYLGPLAFNECCSLKNINIPSFYDMEISEGLFEGCTSLRRVVIPKNITTIGRCAFFDCWNLETIEILSNKITLIGFEAFASCENLRRIDFLDGVTTIEDGAFIGCCELTEITLPSSVCQLGFDIFRGDDKLTVFSSSKQVIAYCKNNNVVYSH